MKLVDLFCGAGGFSLGAHQAGFQVAAAFDLDPILTASYAFNFPNTDLHLRDVSTLTGAEIERLVGGKVDGVFGGPPCQGFSSIGRRDVNDPRRDLLQHFFRLVDELRPKFFVMENVRGLAYKDVRPLLNQAIGRVSSNYSVLEPVLLDAAEYGAATSRVRMFVLGFDPSRCPPLTISHLLAQRKSPATVRAAISDLVGATILNDLSGDFDTWRISKSGRPSAYASALRSTDGFFTGNRRTAHAETTVARFSTVEPGTYDPVGRHYRLQWEGLCPTLRAGTGADRGSYQSVRPLHPEENRVITVREAARLQGFPDCHRFHPTIWHSFRMIGNSVSPLMSHAIFAAIKAALEEERAIEAELA